MKSIEFINKVLRLGDSTKSPSITVDVVDEAEQGTKEARTISKTLTRAGYEQIGEGMDATVWAKEGSNNVLKIIMPESFDITTAAFTFKKFVNFCLQHQDIDCLPKFTPVDKNYYSEFNIGSRTYIQVFMEKLYPIKKNSFEEGLVWFMSDYATKNYSWDKIKSELSNPNSWSLHFARYANSYSSEVAKLSKQKEAEYKLLYTVMVLLYNTGRINKLYWDLHTENIMKRNDGTLVIVDPWFEQEFSN